MKLVLLREGEFNPLNMVETNNRCGQLGLMHYKYAVQVEATDDSLSKEGFVIENSRLHNYFLTRYCNPKKSFKALSCENMAIKAAMEIGRTLIKEKISVTGVTVTITGANNARIQATWTRPETENARPKANAGTRKAR